MKYLVLLMISIFFVASLLTSCSKYHSKSPDCPSKSASMLEIKSDNMDLSEMDDFDYPPPDVNIEVYKIKFYAIVN